MHTTPVCGQDATSSQRARCLESACSRLKLVVHSPKDRRIHDPHGKPQQVATPATSAPGTRMKSCTTGVIADCPTSSIQFEISGAELEQKMEAAHTAPTACDRVLMLRPADQTTVYAPLTVSYGTKQAQTSLCPQHLTLVAKIHCLYI